MNIGIRVGTLVFSDQTCRYLKSDHPDLLFLSSPGHARIRALGDQHATPAFLSWPHMSPQVPSETGRAHLGACKGKKPQHACSSHKIPATTLLCILSNVSRVRRSQPNGARPEVEAVVGAVVLPFSKLGRQAAMDLACKPWGK